MPIPPIASQTRSLDAKDCSDFASAYLRDQALESRSFYKPRSGATQIVVYDDNFLEPQFPRIICQRVLAALAF